MGVSTYQIQNILRVYNKQIRFERFKTHDKKEPVRLPVNDEVNISGEGKKEQIFKEVASQVVEQTFAKVSKTRLTADDGHEKLGKIDKESAEGEEVGT